MPLFKFHHDFQEVYALGSYEDPLRSVVLDFKLRQKTRLVWRQLLSLKVALETVLSGVDILVPIPNSLLRVHHYGFSPSLGFAQMIHQLCPRLIEGRVLSMKRGMKQVKESESFGEKITKLQGWLHPGFGPNKLKNKHVCLVDDVFNSGATLFIAEKIIRQMKPRSIKSLVIAYTHRDGHHFSPCNIGYQWPHWPTSFKSDSPKVSQCGNFGSFTSSQPNTC